MPEIHFRICWPDGSQETCYSPSTIICEHFTPGACYRLSEFLARSHAGLNAASERVRIRYGAACTLALGQLARIQDRAQHFADDAIVVVQSFRK